MKFFLALDHELLVFEGEENGKWAVESKLKDTEPRSVAIDSSRIYCGTFEAGLWASDDLGKSWKRIGEEDFASQQITSIAIRSDGSDRVLYVGTEPSMLYRSEDGGKTFVPSKAMLNLASSGSWSFPPRPYTHHVRTILSDPTKKGLIYLAIEAGALIRSFDSGKTWKDRVRGGPFDTHNLVSNPNSPGRLYSAAGDGYFESLDYGETWKRLDRGLHHTYLYSVAVHPEDPDTVLISASEGPWSAYNAQDAESHIYRKTKGNAWDEVKKGLPDPQGTTASFLSPNTIVRGEFYAANNKGIYKTSDAGESWTKLDVPWKDSFKVQHVHHVALG